MKVDRPAQYRIFLLTFWLAEDDDMEKPERWRFRIEEPKSQTRWGIVGLGNLLLQLAHKIGVQNGSVDDTEPDNPDSAASPDG